MKWKSLSVSASELRISPTLASGQCFTWNASKTIPGMWTGVFRNRLISLLSTTNDTLVTVHSPVNANNDSITGKCLETIDHDKIISDLYDYFQLEVSLSDLYKIWSKDSNFSRKSKEGIRVLRQDPHETTFSFICTSNNNIKRITGMIRKLCLEFGEFINSFEGIDYYSFPKLTDLARHDAQEKLVELGFGYRAKFVVKSAQWIMENKDLKWLNELRGQPYHIVKDSLLNLPGVGRKVADCICLMSMDVADCVPVDTHVWQMAIRDYKVKMATSKSLTDKNYTVIASCFQNVFGKYAGWAHSVLFAADLKFLEEFSHEWIDKDLPDLKLFEIVSKENSDLSV